VTMLSAEQPCDRCGGVLVPPELYVGEPAPPEADCICFRCGRAFRLVGDPPRLEPIPDISTRPAS